MLTFLGQRQSFCDGINRRNFLKLGAFGAGLTLADQLRLTASAAGTAATTTRPKSAIMVYLPGGPSHIDTYDLKPDAAAEFRGEFKPIKTNVPGIDICELFPMQARMMDKLTIVRSLIANDEHSDSYVMTGYTEQVNRADVGIAGDRGGLHRRGDRLLCLRRRVESVHPSPRPGTGRPRPVHNRITLVNVRKVERVPLNPGYLRCVRLSGCGMPRGTVVELSTGRSSCPQSPACCPQRCAQHGVDGARVTP